MNLCIKCDKGGGKLLVCHESGCPVVVHKDCLGCEAEFDEMGNSWCPYCLCKRASQRFALTKDKMDKMFWRRKLCPRY